MTVTTAQPASQVEIPFPSVAWFRHLGDRMREQRAAFVHLGYIDATMQLSFIDGGPGGRPWNVQLRFEEYDLVDVSEVDAAAAARADFVVECDLETWAEMVQNIVAGEGRPDLHHTLNYLSLPSTPIRVWASDPLGRDLFFRVNQSLQTFIDNCGGFTTRFPEGAG